MSIKHTLKAKSNEELIIIMMMINIKWYKCKQIKEQEGDKKA